MESDDDYGDVLEALALAIGISLATASVAEEPRPFFCTRCGAPSEKDCACEKGGD